MKIHLGGRLFLAAAVASAAAVVTMGFLISLGVHSVGAGPGAAPPAGAPTPVGHEWSQVEGHGTGTGLWWLGTTVDQALELRVNNARALRLEANATSPNIIGGYSGNTVTSGAYGAAICGGGSSGNTNRVTDSYGTIGGGRYNQAGDGAGTTTDRSYATVGGGNHNTASNLYATVAGGIWNTASGLDASVSGGYNNFATADYSAVCGGWENLATDDYGAIGGGKFNQAGDNTAPSTDKTYATVGGGYDNTASGQYATVAGGTTNTASADYATVAGGAYNSATADYATICGGGDAAFPAYANRVTDDYGTVGGGANNQAGDPATPADEEDAATVGGGSSNTASGWMATVGGGVLSTASGDDATVGGGASNEASGDSATVAGGWFNLATDESSTVGGGYSNDASGWRSTIPGGDDNTAAGSYSFAAGRRARANHDGAFVWADSTSFDFWSGTADQFLVRASGGVVLYTNSGLATGVYFGADGRARFDVNNDEAVLIYDDGTNLITTTAGAPGARLTIGGTWTNASSRDGKENFTPVDGQEVLASLASMPITTWNHKVEDPSIRHMGPTGQDFYAAFGLGDSDTSIGTLDADGVALAAIQGLYQLSQEQAARIEQLEAEKASAGPLSSGLTAGWLALGGLVLAGLVAAAVQRRRAGGQR